MKPFWRQEPLTEEEVLLLDGLFCAHYKSVFKSNASTQTVLNALGGSGDYSKAIAAAILTIGGLHAPLAQSMQLLSCANPVAAVQTMLISGERVPGWGTNLGEMNEWKAVRARIATASPALDSTIEAVTHVLWTAGKKIDPNPSTFTAATALIVGLPEKIAPYLFILGRLNGWTELCLA